MLEQFKTYTNSRYQRVYNHMNLYRNDLDYKGDDYMVNLHFGESFKDFLNDFICNLLRDLFNNKFKDHKLESLRRKKEVTTFMNFRCAYYYPNLYDNNKNRLFISLETQNETKIHHNSFKDILLTFLNVIGIDFINIEESNYNEIIIDANYMIRKSEIDLNVNFDKLKEYENYFDIKRSELFNKEGE
jgi:hypothetical protein